MRKGAPTYIARARVRVVDGFSVVSRLPSEKGEQDKANAEEDCQHPKHPSPSESLGDDPGEESRHVGNTGNRDTKGRNPSAALVNKVQVADDREHD